MNRSQFDYWNSVGPGKDFAHPIDVARLGQWVAHDARVLDYGCGSGILAIAAAKLGAARVDATDIDPDAREAAAANARANRADVRVPVKQLFGSPQRHAGDRAGQRGQADRQAYEKRDGRDDWHAETGLRNRRGRG